MSAFDDYYQRMVDDNPAVASTATEISKALERLSTSIRQHVDLAAVLQNYAETCEALAQLLKEPREALDCDHDEDKRAVEARLKLTLLANGMRNLARDIEATQ